MTRPPRRHIFILIPLSTRFSDSLPRWDASRARPDCKPCVASYARFLGGCGGPAAPPFQPHRKTSQAVDFEDDLVRPREGTRTGSPGSFVYAGASPAPEPRPAPRQRCEEGVSCQRPRAPTSATRRCRDCHLKGRSSQRMARVRSADDRCVLVPSPACSPLAWPCGGGSGRVGNA